MGGAVIFVITIASIVASLIYEFVLAPLGLDWLNTIVFILVIAALVQIVEMLSLIHIYTPRSSPRSPETASVLSSAGSSSCPEASS